MYKTQVQEQQVSGIAQLSAHGLGHVVVIRVAATFQKIGMATDSV